MHYLLPIQSKSETSIMAMQIDCYPKKSVCLALLAAPLVVAFAPPMGRLAVLRGHARAVAIRPMPVSRAHGLRSPESARTCVATTQSPNVARLARLAKHGAQIGGGAVAIFAIERSLWAASAAAGVRIPTAPAGMLLVFAVLLMIHTFSPKMAGQIKDWFAPSLIFYSKGVPLFFSPPLVQLPLSLGMLPLLTIFKYIALITTGTILSLVATGLAANALVSPPSALSPGAPATRIGTACISTSQVVFRTSPVLKAAVAGMLIFAGDT